VVKGGGNLHPESGIRQRNLTLFLSEKCIQISDKGTPIRGPDLDLKSRISAKIAVGDAGAVWTPVDFLDLGPRDPIDKALQRLAAAGDLRRIDRGLYDRPRINALTAKPSAPDYRAVVEAIARRDQTRMLVDGMTAANDLGLSDAVPGRVVVHTDARIRPIHLGNLTVTFRPTAASKLYWAGRPAMRIVQALHWLKPTLTKADDDQRIKRRLKSLLSDPKQAATLRKDLADGWPSLPAWMQDFIREVMPDEPSSSSKPMNRTTATRNKVTPA
jgi:hypothetical protein